MLPDGAVHLPYSADEDTVEAGGSSIMMVEICKDMRTGSPRLSGRCLQRDDLDHLHAWLSGGPGADAIRAAQKKLMSFSTEQRGLGEVAAGLSGLLRATHMVRTSTDI